MSTPMAETTKGRRSRRRFDDDFKAQAVRLVLDEGKSVGAVARDLDLTETALREWVQRARANRTRGRTGLTTAEREELTQLRKENRQLGLRAGDPKKRRRLLCERASDTFALIHARKAIYPIATMCQVLGVSASGYDEWC